MHLFWQYLCASQQKRGICSEVYVSTRKVSHSHSCILLSVLFGLFSGSGGLDRVWLMNGLNLKGLFQAK